MLTLRDGAKELPLAEGKTSIEVGEIANLVDTLETIRSAVLAGEINPALEGMIKTKPKTPAGKSKN